MLKDAILLKLKAVLSKKGNITVTVSGIEGRDTDVTGDINEFILVARQGTNIAFNAYCSPMFMLAAVDEIKNNIDKGV